MAANHFGEHAFSPQPPSPSPHHAGQKRRADDEVETHSNISTQFKKLRINNVPVRPHLHDQPLLSAHHAAVATPDILPPRSPSPTLTSIPTSPPPSISGGDFMPIDETSNRIVIHDLDAEIAAIEAEEPKPQNFFLADLDKKVAAIPHYILQSRQDNANTNTQLILYRDPTSISVPEEEDAVRKAIFEARKRTRERQAEERRQEEGRDQESVVEATTGDLPWPCGKGYQRSLEHDYGHEMNSDHAPSHYYTEEEEDDPDAMDIG